jgi:hypothetical protein
MDAFLLMVKLELEKPIQYQEMKIKKIKVFCPDLLNFCFNKSNRNKEIIIYNLK